MNPSRSPDRHKTTGWSSIAASRHKHVQLNIHDNSRDHTCIERAIYLVMLYGAIHAEGQDVIARCAHAGAHNIYAV